VTCDAALWAACVGGAMQRDAYRQGIEAAGFEIDTWRTNTEYRFVSERADNARRHQHLVARTAALSDQWREAGRPARSAPRSEATDSSVRHAPSVLATLPGDLLEGCGRL